LLQPSYVLVLNLVGSATALFVFFHVLMKGYATTRQEVLVKSAEIIGAYDDLNTQKEALKQNLEEMQAQQEELRRVEAHLRASQQQMQELNATLEHRVEERTRELKAAMDNLKNTQAKMVESEKMATLGNLVAGVAHEINTPVGIAVTAASHLQHSIQNFAETVNGGQIRKSDIARVVSEGTEASDIILKNLERASELVQSFKKVAVNQSTECVEEFHLRQYTDEIITSLRPTLRKTKLEVVNSLPDVVLLGLPSAFSQIIINFVTNSIRYAYDEGAPGTLRLWAEVDNDRVHIHYNDDGKGIPPENLPKIFDPFFTTGRTRGGSGLGLNIVYNLVTQKMEGDIRVESTVGQGTTFHLSLPLRLATTT
jgi:signal transduction histidine kinase